MVPEMCCCTNMLCSEEMPTLTEMSQLYQEVLDQTIEFLVEAQMEVVFAFWHVNQSENNNANVLMVIISLPNCAYDGPSKDRVVSYQNEVTQNQNTSQSWVTANTGTMNSDGQVLGHFFV